MSVWNAKANEIFLQAVEYSTAEDCRTFIDRAGAGDAALRAEVEDLLQAHSAAGSFLAEPAFGKTIDMPAAATIAETPGAVIGPYKLLKQIGEGGMGSVYMAEQAAPVRRTVALKIIKPGMDTREVIARFEAERQALALMDHPNIARVFDAGATAAGRPYFVMELVRGVPITDYCDQNNLPVHERLELFVTVCHAVQHAHQKGIIHRDIKPSNVLVTMHDGRPVPKVIDFGVAKAVGQQLTDKTLFTQLAQIVGTPLYMSPEQAQLTGLDVDTRGDIYSLGVLLYELLTGSTPLERGRMKQAALDEIRRMIREEDPPSPSMRLSSTAGEAQSAVAAHRRLDPRGLSRLVRGDLDWIVMKALEKDRNRRYETANGFAADVLHYLADEPVLACPPSTGYRLRKFGRRNKLALVMIGSVTVALLVGTVVSTWQAVRASSAEKIAERHLRDEQEARIAAEEAQDQALANLRKAHEAVDRFLTRVGENELVQTPHLQQLQRKLLEDAMEFNEGFLVITAEDRDLQLEAAVARLRVGIIKVQMGEFATAEEDCLLSLTMLQSLSEALPGDPRPRAEMVRACHNLGFVFDHTHPEGPQREEIRRRAVELIDQLIEDFPERQEFQLGRASSYLYLGVVLMNNHNHDAAESVLNRALKWSEELGEMSLIGQCSRELARLYLDTSRLDQAETTVRIAIDVYQELDNGRSWYSRMTLAESHLRRREILSRLGRAAEGEAELAQSLSLWTALGRDYPDRVYFPDRLAYVAEQLGEALRARGKLVEAVVVYRRSVEAECRLISREPKNARHHSDLRIRFNWLDALLDQTGRKTERQQVAGDVMAIYRSLLAEHPDNAALQTEFDRFQRQWMGCLMERGTVSEREQAARDGIAQLEERFVRNPAAPEGPFLAYAHSILGQVLHEQQRNEEALTTWRQGFDLLVRLLDAAPADAGLRDEFRRYCTRLDKSLSVANQMNEAGQFTQEVITLYEKLAAAKTDDTALCAELCIMRSRSYLAVQQPDQALLEITRAIACVDKFAVDHPQVFAYRQELGRLLSEFRQWAEAEAEYTKAIELRPEASEVWSGRAYTHFHRRQWDRAIADFSRAIELAPQVHGNWWHRGHSHLALAQWDKAAADFGKVVDQWPDGAGGWYLRGVAFANLNQPDKALADLRQAIANGFTNVEQMNNDSRLDPLRSREDFGEVLKEFERKGEAQSK